MDFDFRTLISEQGFEFELLCSAIVTNILLQLEPIGDCEVEQIQALSTVASNQTVTAAVGLDLPFLVGAAQIAPLVNLCPINEADTGDVHDFA